MMHQARPMPPHLRGQENISFSINQILSPISEESSVEDEGRYHSYPMSHYDVKNRSEKSPYDNGCFYPRLGNYWGRGDRRSGSRIPESSVHYLGNGYCHDNNSDDHVTNPAPKHNLNCSYPSSSANPCHAPNPIAPASALTEFSSLKSSGLRPLSGPNADYPNFQFSCSSDCRYPRSGKLGTEPQYRHRQNDYSGTFNTSKCFENCCSGYVAAVMTRRVPQTSYGSDHFLSPANSSTVAPSQPSFATDTFSATSAVTQASFSGKSSIYFPSSGSLHEKQLSVNFPWMESKREKIALTRRLRHSYQSRTPPKKKKPRTSFSRIQICELEKRFHRQKYLASSERISIAKHLKMTNSQVKTWFQNRRTKWRRQTTEERAAERQAAQRLINQLQQEALARTPIPAPDPLCLRNASLFALHRLQARLQDVQ